MNARPHIFNDLYHARKVVEFYGRHIRYCAKLGGFIIWNGKHWSLDETAQVWRWAVDAVSLAYEADFASAPDPDRPRLNRWFARAQTRWSIENALRHLQAQPEIIATPDHFDRDPWLLNVNNGAIDLRTGNLREHRPDDLITKIATIDFDPASPPPDRWSRFLDEIFGGNRDLINFVQRVCGYALTGSVCEQKLFLLHGSGANGKPTFLEKHPIKLEFFLVQDTVFRLSWTAVKRIHKFER
ncbi:MAG: hypothetical protein C4532_06295 [Candidatus Abyssobacteria bacterium SURF_17]|uniref:Bacteriophage/plasmid primase P4 C-terminal domain-containing protein n=1 Tax=Candidatus Abyssobacteria bacterium SURF_17 TaxID=2093361 RepID=A0A419F2K3_9BACT|nr:MAG: hypothetical protein C4532_06295 [Candidatus Abyssubacteria bacterium SURF_17]